MVAARTVAARTVPALPVPLRGARLAAVLALALLALAVLGAAPAHADTAPAAPAAAAADTTAATQPSAQTTMQTTAQAAAQPAADVQLSDRAFAIAKELRCPVCTAESVADSNAEIAGEMRRLIQQQLDAGKTREQILSYFRQRYGDWIMLDPPKTGLHLLVWILPLVAALAGVVTLGLLFRRWRIAAERTPTAAPDELERVRSALRAQEDEI